MAYTGLQDQFGNFFTAFYATSDDPEVIEQYADRFFKGDARVTMASRVANGREEIIKLRTGMVSSVKSRKHSVYEVYPNPAMENEFMLRGKVEYVQLDDSKTKSEWAAWAKFEFTGAALKLAEYQVYIDTGRK